MGKKRSSSASLAGRGAAGKRRKLDATWLRSRVGMPFFIALSFAIAAGQRTIAEELMGKKHAITVSPAGKGAATKRRKQDAAWLVDDDSEEDEDEDEEEESEESESEGAATAMRPAGCVTGSFAGLYVHGSLTRRVAALSIPAAAGCKFVVARRRQTSRS